MEKITITNKQKIMAALNPQKSAISVNISGIPLWVVQSGDATLNVALDGMSAIITAGAAFADSMIKVTVSADLGKGIEQISDTIILTVIDARSESLGLIISSPLSK